MHTSVVNFLLMASTRLKIASADVILNTQLPPTILFKDAAERFLNVHADTWKNPTVQRRTWESSLQTFAFPTLARRPIEAITNAVLTETLAPIWTKQPATAQKVKQRVTKICDWIRSGQPMPQVAPSKRVKHRAALPFADVPAFMKELLKKDALSARALEFTILNAVRVIVYFLTPVSAKRRHTISGVCLALPSLGIVVGCWPVRCLRRCETAGLNRSR